jgi:hypothetical protein
MLEETSGIAHVLAGLKEMLKLSYEDHLTVNSTPALQVVGRHRSRQLWREMQGAYKGYIKASAALERFVSRPLFPVWRTDDPRVGRLMAEQRVSFENYIDARLRFVEFHHDQNIVTAHDWTPQNNQVETIWSSSVERRLLIVANLVLLALTVFSSLYVLREQKLLRQHTLVSERIAAAAVRPTIPTIQSSPAANAPADPPPAVITHESALVSNATAPGARTQQDSVARPNSASQPIRAAAKTAGNSYSFRLAPSNQLRQVGSARISVGSVDPRRQKLTVSFLAGSAIVQRRIRLRVPVWINSHPGRRPIKLVITRIEANRVQGYVVESANKSVAVATDHSGIAAAGKS